MSAYKAEQLYTWLYRIHDPLDVYFYLIVGNDKALLFDTGFGAGDIPETVGKLTDKPLTVVLGHGHLDHANGAYQFGEAYLHEADFELCRAHTSPETRDIVLKRLAEAGKEPRFDPAVWREAGTGNLKKLDFGTVFDLGGLHIEVIDMAGHTPGSAGLLITEHRVLLDSDSANGHCWFFFPEARPLREYAAMLERVKKLEFDIFFTAHNLEAYPKSFFDRYLTAAQNASIDKSEPYNVYPELEPYIYTEDGVSIVFNKRTRASS